MDAALRSEQESHDHARACLAAMRERTARLRATGGDAYAEEAVHALLEQRLAALADDGTTPLFFGRLDYEEAADLGERTFRVGRCHINDADTRPVVIDWRAGVARAFYRASTAEPMGLERRHRYGFARGRLTSMETEVLVTGEGAGIAEKALAREIERPRIGPMRDIVATIQPEQDDLIRAGLDTTMCIQGSPGTGKTAVGLHRAAFLAYTHRQALDRDGVLVVGPNPAFLSYIGNVLPGLGETQVRHVTLPELASAPPVTGADAEDAARLKGSAVMAEVVARAFYARVAPPSDPLVLRVHGRRYRLEAGELRELLTAVLRAGVPYRAARQRFVEQLVRDLARQVERRGAVAGFDPHRDVARAVRASAEVKELLARTWPAIDPVAVVFELLADDGALAGAAAGLLGDEDVARLVWPRRPRSRKAAPWSLADAFLVDEAAALLERPETFGHVVVDEAQDLSPMQLRAVGRRCRHSSATLLGDLAQATAPWAVGSWDEALASIGKPGGQVVELPRAFRNPRSVLDLASRLLPLIGADVTPAVAVREVPDALAVRSVPAGEVPAAAVEATREALAAQGSVGVIVAPEAVEETSAALERGGVAHAELTSFEDPQRVTLVPATAVKGLEFDQVVLVEPARIAESGLAWLYIAMTRAVVRLAVVHSRPIPGS